MSSTWNFPRTQPLTITFVAKAVISTVLQAHTHSLTMKIKGHFTLLYHVLIYYEISNRGVTDKRTASYIVLYMHTVEFRKLKPLLSR